MLKDDLNIMLKKVLLVTLYDENNIGNRLQNYALQKKLKNYGVDITILDNYYRIADFNNENEMQKFLKRKNLWANLKAPVCNFAKRAFCRYPYFSIINVILLVVLVFIKYGS